MSAAYLVLPAGQDLNGAAPAVSVEVSYRSDFADERLSARELEVLAPVLPELVGELLALMNMNDETE